MKLSELLSELRSNVLRDITDAVGDDADARLWDDPSLVRYLDDAQNQFAVRSLCLRDETTTAVTRITLVEGTDSYALDSRVVAIYGARIGTRHLARTTYAGLYSNRGDVTLGDVRISLATNGLPKMFYADRETQRVGVYPAPDATYAGQQLILRVARKPLLSLAIDDLDAEPEIPSEFHLDLVEWAAWRALRNHDADGENMAKANSHKKRFEDTLLDLSRKAKRLLAQDIQFDLRNNWSC